MDPKKLVEEHKIYLEDLERWVVPLEVVDQALAIKSAKELDDNLDRLQDNMTELGKIFKDLGRVNG